MRGEKIMKKKILLVVAVAFVCAFSSFLFAADVYEIDPVHSDVAFTVRHLVISNVRGHFKEFTGTILYDPNDITKSSVSGTIKTASIDTGNEKRDADLKGAGFFDVEKYPEIAFKSDKIEKTGGGYTAIGILTIRGISKQIRLPFTLSGPIQDPWGNTKIGIEASTTINRQDYNVSWNQKLDNGGVVVGDEVKISLNAEAIKKK
jgi:polyisoprenoid-binding protein YceI